MNLRSCLLLFILACGTDPAEDTNEAPTARLRVPVIAALDQPTALDASASTDPDGDTLSYTFEFFYDGAAPVTTSDATIQHSFPREQLFTVRVRVADPDGLEDTASQEINVRDDFPDPPDFCAVASDCTIGDECTGGICYVR